MKQLSIPELHDTATILYTLAAPDTLAILQFLMDYDTSEGVPTEKDIAELTRFDLFTVKWNVNKLASVGIVAVTPVETFSEPEARLVAINMTMPPVAFRIVNTIWIDWFEYDMYEDKDKLRTGDVLLTDSGPICID